MDRVTQAPVKPLGQNTASRNQAGLISNDKSVLDCVEALYHKSFVHAL
jgi:hypothetical protein